MSFEDRLASAELSAWFRAQIGAAESVMNVLDLVKATIACGALSFLIYSFPIVGQVTLITFLGLLWLGYAHRTIAHLRRR
jgi:hypothetical protein